MTLPLWMSLIPHSTTGTERRELMRLSPSQLALAAKCDEQEALGFMLAAASVGIGNMFLEIYHGKHDDELIAETPMRDGFPTEQVWCPHCLSWSAVSELRYDFVLVWGKKEWREEKSDANV